MSAPQVTSFTNGRPHRWIAAVCGAVIICSCGPAAAQQDKPEPSIRGDIALRTEDDWPIYITYYQSGEGRETPIVLLLHMYGGNRLVWDGDGGFAKQLWSDGYAVITADLRKHGQSQSSSATKSKSKSRDATGLKPADYEAMVEEDLKAIREFVFEEHQKQHLNMNKLAIIAPEMSAPLAVHYTKWDWSQEPYKDAPTESSRTPRGHDVRALVLLSPVTNLPRLPTGKIMKELRDPDWNIAFLVLYSEEDPIDRGQAKRMFQQVAGRVDSDDRMYLKEYKNKLRGTDALGRNLMVEEYVLSFLGKYLKGASGTWRDRRSRYDRD